MRTIKSGLYTLLTAFFVFIVGLTLHFSELHSTPQQSPSNGILSVHFIDVGQGDSIAIITPKNRVMLIDGGTRAYGEKVVRYLKKRGFSTIHVLVATHPHADHIGGLIHVLNELSVLSVYDSSYRHTTQTYEEFLTTIDRMDIPYTTARRGNRIDLCDDVKITILHPTDIMRDVNDSSIVLHMTYRNNSFLFTGDAEKNAENAILEFRSDIRADVLKVGHHGSSTSTTPSFLKAVSPAIAVIQVGRNNRYGHPARETLEILSQNKVAIYRSDLHGTVVLTSNGSLIESNSTPYVYAQSRQSAQEFSKEQSESSSTININSASRAELTDIIHIGDTLADEIIRLRPFSSLDDLSRVSGIGVKRLEDIKKEGAAHVD